MLIRTLYFEQTSIIASVVCSLIVAGLLKGIIGVGMPIVALPLLSLFIDIKSAAMLLSMPLIFSNLPQALEGGKTGRCLMQLMPAILGMIPISEPCPPSTRQTSRRFSKPMWSTSRFRRRKTEKSLGLGRMG